MSTYRSDWRTVKQGRLSPPDHPCQIEGETLYLVYVTQPTKYTYGVYRMRWGTNPRISWDGEVFSVVASGFPSIN